MSILKSYQALIITMICIVCKNLEIITIINFLKGVIIIIFIKAPLVKKTKKINKEARIILLALCVGLAFTFLAAYAVSAYASGVQNELSRKVIRCHILAKSDEAYDQELKNNLRDALFEEYGEKLSAFDFIDETKLFILSELNEIKAFSDNYIRNAGYDYMVQAALVRDFFPASDYGIIAFPAGRYEALRITIGEGQGNNFWCVMFPPLCFVSESRSGITPQSNDLLKKALPGEEYSIIAGKAPNSPIEYKIKFKVVELWENQTRK